MLMANEMVKFELPGVPAGGLRRVGQIRGTNTLTLRVGQNGMVVALELLSSHMHGAPVVDEVTSSWDSSVNLMSSMRWKRAKIFPC